MVSPIPPALYLRVASQKLRRTGKTLRLRARIVRSKAAFASIHQQVLANRLLKRASIF
jgi:hypothetical protein